MKNKIIFFIVNLISILRLAGQGEIPVGTWRMHLSYYNVIDISLAKDKVYAATANALFSYDPTDNSIRTITKTSGLSSTGITAIAFCNTSNTLVVGYNDGNIDLISDHVVKNIPIIKQDNFTVNKTINSIYCHKSKAYFATEYGISILDLVSHKVTETIVNLGPSTINQVAIVKDSIFAATSQGVMATRIDPAVNILDFNNWKTYKTPTTEIISIANYEQGLMIAEKKGNLYEYSQGSWTQVPHLQGKDFVNLTQSSNGIVIVTDTDTWTYEKGSIAQISTRPYHTRKAIKDKARRVWLADSKKGLIKKESSVFEEIRPSGPTSDFAFRAVNSGSDIFVLAGGYTKKTAPSNITDGYYKFDATKGWTSYNSASTGILIPKVKDLVGFTYHPSRKQHILGSFQDGILIVNEDNSTSTITHSTNNTTLETNTITDLAYATDGVWVLNYGASRPLHVWSDKQTWKSYALSNTAAKFPLELLIAPNDDKWLRINPSKGGGIFVFNENTGKQRYLTKDANLGGLPSNTVYSLATDRDGKIWVGTSRGMAFFNNSSSIKNNNPVNAVVPKENGRTILGNENILSIAIDGGNRKWIGTDVGAWLIESNTHRQINHFTTKNSPLPSDTVRSIAIRQQSGEVFFVTTDGVVSYRGTATEAKRTHQQVKIFPNPVTNQFSGLVAISGLAQDAIVKITDISGKLIRQMQANGGTATWDVKDYKGNRATTGVYLVFSATQDGEDSLVSKIAVVN